MIMGEVNMPESSQNNEILLSYTILTSLEDNIKSEFRILERKSIKLIKTTNHLLYNETCINNSLLPTYTNIRLHDDAARLEPFVLDFRKDLILRQIRENKELINNLQCEIVNQKKLISELMNSETRYNALMIFLDRTLKRVDSESREIKLKKLCETFGGDILLKQNRDSVINLSSVELDSDIRDIFSLGMNCHLKTKFNSIKRKAEVEKLYEDICEGKRNNTVTVENDDELKCQLERFGLQSPRDFQQDLLTREQFQKIRNFNSIDSIIVRKADKSNIFVVLDKDMYLAGVNDILQDITKFNEIQADTTNAIKNEINELTSKINQQVNKTMFPKLVGQYSPGYLYANPKIHKDITNPPFRPIISQIGTPVYEIAKKLNDLIVHYTPSKYVINSTYNFVSTLKTLNPGNGTIASLDVKDLFTNVPVQTTIELIMDYMYNSQEKPPPNIDRNHMEQLLLICTTKMPFRSPDGKMYVQVEGCSMGSPLSCTIANFYMCHLENSVLTSSPGLSPPIYGRYVDDIFMVVDSPEQLLQVKEAFERNSVLKFTVEHEKSKQLAFLDCLINRDDHKFTTSVYVKPTHGGDCINYNGLCPQRYKTGVINTLLHRAYAISSSWTHIHKEISRVRQLLTNNNFPIDLIDKEINKFLTNKLETSVIENQPPTGSIVYYFENQMTSNYKNDEKSLHNIIEKHVKPVKDNEKVKLIVFYRNKKLSKLFIKNKPITTIDASKEHHVVYQYTCDHESCNSANKYIGYTTTTLYQRFGCHTQNGSIKKHLTEEHAATSLRRSDLIKNTKVLHRDNRRRDLIFIEALYIKELSPTLNAQDEGCDRILKIFKH